MTEKLEYRSTFLASVFMKKVNWDQPLSMVEANSQGIGTQSRKRKEQVCSGF